ncbi:hypothetical protein ABC766_06585 [Methylobacterium fujisawaense]|uniref:hypothetical protein n=1 Tax=Methylobacterium fujisawaense TaxID=107400 RepID=UPI0031F5D5E3
MDDVSVHRKLDDRERTIQGINLGLGFVESRTVEHFDTRIPRPRVSHRSVNELFLVGLCWSPFGGMKSKTFDREDGVPSRLKWTICAPLKLE